MLSQLPRMHGYGMLLEILGRTDNRALNVPQANSGQVRVMQYRHPDCEVEALLGQRLAVIREKEVVGYLWVLLEELCKIGRHVISAKCHRSCDSKFSGRNLGVALYGTVCLSDLVQDTTAPLIIEAPAVS
jgi:hypothetical protein